MDESMTHRPRMHVRNRYVLLGDLALVAVSVMGSFALRLDVGELPFYFPAILIMLAVALLVKLPVYYFFGLYRRLWIYASTNELRLITVAVTTASVLTAGVMLVLISLGLVLPGMPRSALGIDWLLSLILIGGIGGLLVGMTSIGGGTVIMALLLIFFSIPLNLMVGIDVVHGALLTVITSMNYVLAGQTDWSLVVLLLIGSLPGAWLGVHAIKRIDVRIVRGILALVVIGAGIDLLLR